MSTSARITTADREPIPLHWSLLRLLYGELGMDLKTIARLTGHTKHAVEQKVAMWEVEKWRGLLRELGEDNLRDVAILLGNPSIAGYMYQGRMTDKLAVLRRDLVERADRGEVDWRAVGALAALLDRCGHHARFLERRAALAARERAGEAMVS